MLLKILLIMALQSSPLFAIPPLTSTAEICAKWLTKKAQITPGFSREVIATVIPSDHRYILSNSGHAVLLGDVKLPSGSHLLYYYPLEVETFRRDPTRILVVDESEIHHTIVRGDAYERYMDILTEERKGSVQATIDLAVEKSGRFYTISLNKFKEF